jgi:hypothetical protein
MGRKAQPVALYFALPIVQAALITDRSHEITQPGDLEVLPTSAVEKPLVHIWSEDAQENPVQHHLQMPAFRPA